MLTVVLAAACSEIPNVPDPSVLVRMPAQAASVRGESRPIPGEYVVQLRAGAQDQLRLMQSLMADNSGTVRGEYLELAGAFVARVSDEAATRLRKDPSVRSVSPNYTIAMSTPQWGPANWGVRRVDQRNLPMDTVYWYPAGGAGTHIYFIDTGVDGQHEEFGARATGGASMVGDNIGTLDGCGSHGTMVASAAAGVNHGTSKQAWVHPVKVMDRYCWGDINSYLAGLEWIRVNHVKPAVVNASVGFTVLVPAVDAAVANLISTTGISFVTAAGNDFSDACNRSPAGVPAAITVAATDSFDIKTSWSNYGSCVDLFAPGIDLTVAWYDFVNFPNDHNDWAVAFGTSLSAPLVAGVVANYLQRMPNANAAAVHAHIVNNATNGVVTAPGAGSPNKLLYQEPTTVLSVALQGPSVVKPSVTCGWNASASGGVGPYVYFWYKNGALVQQGPNSLYTTSLASAATISVTAYGSYGSSGSASRSVTVSSTAKNCTY